MRLPQIDIKYFVAFLFLAGITIQGMAQRSKRGQEPLYTDARLRESESAFIDGERFFLLEDYSKALVFFQRALDLNPDNAAIHYKMAQSLLPSNKQEDLTKASVHLEQAIKLESGNKYYYLLGANVYNTMGRFDKSADLYIKMMQTIPGTEEYIYDLASAYRYANKMDDALKTYNHAEELFGVNEVSSLQKQQILLDQNRVDDAIQEGQKLIQAYPKECSYSVSLANMLAQHDHKNEAISLLEAFIQKNPAGWSAQMLLSSLYADRGDKEQSRKIILALFDNSSADFESKVLMLGALRTEIQKNRANKIVDADKESFAFQLFEKIKVTNPQESTIHILGGDLHLAVSQDTEALNEYLEATRLGASNFEVWKNIAVLDIELNKFDEAIKQTNAALELYPNQAILYYYNGYAFLRKKKYNESIYAFEQAKRLLQDNPSLTSDLNAFLGDAYNAIQNYVKSDAAYEASLESNPDNQNALNNYSYFLSLRKHNLDKAERMASELCNKFPNTTAYLDTYAWVLYQEKKYKEAKKIIEQAIATGKASQAHFDHYGDILFQLNDVDGAVKQWEKAKAFGANPILDKKIANRKVYDQ